MSPTHSPSQSPSANESQPGESHDNADLDPRVGSLSVSQADLICFGSAAALLLFCYLPWFRTQALSKTTASGIHYLTGQVVASLAVSFLVLLATTRLTKITLHNKTLGPVLFWSAAACVALILIQLLAGPDSGSSQLATGTKRETSLGIYLALGAAVTMVYSSYLQRQDTPTSP